jgi:hypothetical protein
VIRAYSLARRLGDEERTGRYRQACRLGLGFVQRLQIMPETAMLFPDPSRAVGAITRSLSDFSLRCDNDQHALTAYLAAVEAKELLDA